MTEVKLNLAAGRQKLPGYINIDNKTCYNGDFDVDVDADIFTLDWEKDSVDEILLSHFMMYVPYEQALTLLTKWFSWLKPGGKILIETGDLKAIAKLIVESDSPDEINGDFGLKQVFGWGDSVGHKWCWCPETLRPLVEKAGFKNVMIYNGKYHAQPARDFLLIANK